MPEELRLALGLALGIAATLLATPVAIRIAHRTGLLDHPRGYKGHRVPTPCLGGLAIAVGVAAGVTVAGPGIGDLLPLFACAAALLVVGTIDDRFQLGIAPRLICEAACAVVLFSFDLGLEPFSSDAVNFILTLTLVIGVVNAYNLMDNLDGAAGTVGGVSAAGVGIMAAVDGSTALAVVGLAVAGACAGFLRYNLADPAARIFLGDGGSMMIGLLVSGLITGVVPSGPEFEWGTVGVALLLAGLPAFDTALVVVSRWRRGVSTLSGGRDHLSHRFLVILHSPRRVALALGAVQASLVLCASVVRELDQGAAVAVTLALVGLAVAMIAALERPLPFSVRQSSA